MSECPACATLRTERDAAIREADRLRHGMCVEGDFVCPRALECDDLRAENSRLMALLGAAMYDLEQLR